MRYTLRLYVTGRSGYSVQALQNIERICEERLKDAYDLEVIDVLEHTELAERQKIVATPTLVRELPPPRRKILGDLSDTKRVLLGLDLVP